MVSVAGYLVAIPSLFKEASWFWWWWVLSWIRERVLMMGLCDAAREGKGREEGRGACQIETGVLVVDNLAGEEREVDV